MKGGFSDSRETDSSTSDHRSGKRKIFKSLQALFLAAAIALSLTGCGSGAGRADSAGTNPAESDGTNPAEPYGMNPAEPDGGAESGNAGDSSWAEDSETYRVLASKHQQQKSGAEELRVLSPDLPAPKKNCTVMIYMIGSNLESQFGAGSRDLREIMDAGVDYDRSNVIVYAGGSQKWNSDIPGSSNSVLDMSLAGRDSWITAATEGNSDMGHPDTLASFLNFCTDHYPADHYALIFWNHGAGPVWGYGSDELFDEDSLLLEEMRSAMDRSVFSGQKLDFVGFDACLMSCLENARLWSDYAEYMAASEELETGDGWDYSFLSVLNGEEMGQGPLGLALGTRILETFESFHNEKRSETFDPDITLALVDLSKISGLIEAVDGLAAEMEKEVASGRFAGLSRLRRESRAFGLTAVRSRSDGYDLIDLQSLSEAMGGSSPAESQSVRQALDEAVVSFVTNVEDAGGLSLYFPGENMDLYKASEGLLTGSGAVSENYDRFIRTYAERWTASSMTDWTLAEPEAAEGGGTDSGTEGETAFSIQLTEDQLADLSEASYSVMYKAYNGTYYMAASGLPVEPDDRGRLNIPADPMLIGIEDKSGGTGRPWPFSVVDRRNGTLTMCSSDMVLSRSADSLSSDMNLKVTMTIAVRDDRVSIQSVSAAENSASAGGKSTVDLTEYDTIAHSYVLGIFPTRREDGSMLPWEEWNNGSSSGKYQVLIEDNMSFSAIPSSAFEAEYLVQVQVTDVNGQQHAAELFEMTTDGASGKAEITNPAGSGTLTFALYEDHAALTDYEGDDARLEMPAEVEGLPVTAIGPGAVYDKWSIEEAVIPEGITAIGSGAFERCVNMERIQLPGSLTDLSHDAFYECRSLTGFVMTEPSDSFSVRDGVLFTGDGSGLLCWPWAKGTEYSVPEGTVYIGKRAFFGSSLEKIVLPESLREIRALGFGECSYLQEVVLPASLQRIGTMAFGGNRDKDIDAYPVMESLVIGREATDIGPEAFSALKGLQSIEVDPENPAYSSLDGYLTNKAEDTILEAPKGMDTGSVTVPEGISGLEPSVFEEFDEYTEFFLPASLVRIPEELFPTDLLADNGSYSVVLHCPEGSEAEQYAEKKDIFHDNYLSAHEDVSVEGEMGTFYFRAYDSYAAFLAYKGIESSVTIPDTVEGKPVTIIGDGQHALFDYDSELEVEIFGEYNLEAYNLAIAEGKTPQEAEDAAYADCTYGRDNYSKMREMGVGSLKNLTIPDSVTTIRCKAFRNLYYPDRVTIPASVTEIEEGAFSEYRGKAILVEEGSSSYKSYGGLLYSADGSLLLGIPGNPDYAEMKETEGLLERVYSWEEGVAPEGADADAYYYRLTLPEGTVRIAKEAGLYLSAGDSAGILLQCPSSLREIGKKAFFNAHLSGLALNDGLVTIGANAFERTNLVSLDLPDSVETIEQYAFHAIGGLDRLELPASLEKVDFMCFGVNMLDIKNLEDNTGEGAGNSSTGSTGEEISEEVLVGTVSHCQEVVIGARVEEIDNYAFCDLPFDNYSISRRNKKFTVTDGMLLSDDGRELISCPSGRRGSVTVPDGVTYLGHACFYDCEGVTDIYLPDSVININGQAFKRYDGEYTVTLHCAPGSYAREAAERMGITCK